ncbi:MAG: hypothetical protein WDW36_005351 [Sanguina aurantia]
MLHIREAVVWTPTSPQTTDARYRGLGDVGAPDLIQYYVFNITNGPDVRLGAKPHLVEVGPFTYRKTHTKLEAWFDRPGRVATRDYSYQTFVPELSVGDLHEPIVTLNLPLIGVIETLHATVSGLALQTLLDLFVSIIARWDDHASVSGLLMKRSPQQLLWGYNDPLLKRLSAFLPPGTIKDTHFRLVYNCSSEEEATKSPYNVYATGSTNLSQTWNMQEAAGVKRVTTWNGSQCDEPVTGSDAFQFPPGISISDKLTVWVSELFRSATLVFKQHTTFHGVKLLRFVPDPQQAEPDSCHYQSVLGLLNVTVQQAVGANGDASAAHGPPVYLTVPHFCGCDPALNASVDGLSCDPDTHTTWIDVEPLTGITMRAHKSMMMSSAMTEAARTHVEPRIRTSTVIPLFWALEQGGITHRQGADFVARVYR